MELKVVEDKSSPKSDQFKRSRSRHQKAMVSNILDAIAQVNGGNVFYHTGEDGAMRMKIVVKKEDLKQVMEIIRDGKNVSGQSLLSSSSTPPSMSTILEQRLNIMRKRHILRASSQSNKVRNRSTTSWRPELQSIPEEL